MGVPQRRGKACPCCHCRETRLSRPRRLERLLGLLFVRPYRCRGCYTRFWRFG